MEIYIILFGISFGCGLFFIFADLVKLPTIASEKAIMNMASRNQNKVSFVDVIVARMAVKISQYLQLNEYQAARLKNILRACGINKTPEEYTANCIAKGALAGVWALPCLLVFPLAAPVFVTLGVLIYLRELGSAEQLIKGKRAKIELELPRFVATISQELKHNRDILRILDTYKPSASKAFQKEIDILTADMRSGSYETALTRFESTINSPQLSDVVRGLIAVLRGDDAVIYFEMLNHDMKQMEIQKLKQEASKIPLKIKKFSFLMLMCFLGTYLVILVYQLIISMATLF